MGQALRLYGNASQTLHTVDSGMIGRRLKTLFRERRFDVVHVHAPYNPGSRCWRRSRRPRRRTSRSRRSTASSRPGPGLDIFAPRDAHPLIGRLDGRIGVSEACIGSLTPYFPFDYT